MPTVVHFEIAADEIESQEILQHAVWLEDGKDAWPDGILDVFHQRRADGRWRRDEKAAAEPNDHKLHRCQFGRRVCQKVEELGGRVKVPKTEVPGHGWFVLCADTENNMFGLWETKPK